MASHMKSNKHTKKEPILKLLKSFQKTEKGKLPKTPYEATITLIPIPDKENQKRKFQADIFDEYRLKSSQNIIKLNPVTHKKDHTPRSSGIQPKFTRLLQHTQISQCATP